LTYGHSMSIPSVDIWAFARRQTGVWGFQGALCVYVVDLASAIGMSWAAFLGFVGSR
jgi:hypothetical protein